MNIKEAQEKKRVVEQEICNLIRSFSKETGLIVEYISADMIDISSRMEPGRDLLCNKVRLDVSL